MKKLKKISIEDFIGIFKFIILIIPAFIRKHILKKELWLISEHYTARDNGYFFYKYMKEKHPEIECFYAMDIKSDDYEKVKGLGNIVKWGSLKHYYYFMSATKNISSHKNGDPNHPLFMTLLKCFNLYHNRVFLQHGIIRNNIPNFYYKNAKFKLFICGAKREYEYIKELYGYPEKNVQYTGLARFDNLHDTEKYIDKKKILLMPTWRRWLNSEEKFVSSKYYQTFQSFINNEKLIKTLEENDKYLYFCPHFGSKDYAHNFSSKSDRIIIIEPIKADIQNLLITSALLITDFSSIFMDFAYMKKPLICYQFDIEEFREKHIQEGYFNDKKDGFGQVINSEEEVIEKIKSYIDLDFVNEKKYLDKIDEFFAIHDTKNCERIYEAIINM